MSFNLFIIKCYLFMSYFVNYNFLGAPPCRLVLLFFYYYFFFILPPFLSLTYLFKKTSKVCGPLADWLLMLCKLTILSKQNQTTKQIIILSSLSLPTRDVVPNLLLLPSLTCQQTTSLLSISYSKNHYNLLFSAVTIQYLSAYSLHATWHENSNNYSGPYYTRLQSSVTPCYVSR